TSYPRCSSTFRMQAVSRPPLYARTTFFSCTCVSEGGEREYETGLGIGLGRPGGKHRAPPRRRRGRQRTERRGAAAVPPTRARGRDHAQRGRGKGSTRGAGGGHAD